MNVKNTERNSCTDWDRVDAMTDEDIDYSDIPPTTEKEFSRAELRFPKHKETVAIQLDSDVLAWFKTHNKGYQAQINTVLRRYIEAQRTGNY